MANPLLDRASPTDLASRGQVIELTEKIERFERLAGIVAQDLATVGAKRRPRDWRTLPVEIRLVFGFADERGEIPALTGSLRTTLAAVCQRCLEPFELPLQASLKIVLPASSGDVAEAAGFETWEREDDLVRPLDIAEEALIMALPLAAMHESGDRCRVATAVAGTERSETVRPFADLRSKMDKASE